MPFLTFYTTLPGSRVPKDFQSKTAALMSQVLKGKPKEKMFVHLITDQNIYSGADPDAKEHIAYAVLRSIGCLTKEENRVTAQVLSAHVKQELGIDDRMFGLFLIDLDPNMVVAKSKILSDLAH